MITIHNVTQKFGQFVAVDNLSLEVREGQFLALLGPNGAGKTTLVEMIEGIQMPTSGEIQIQGLNWKFHEQKLRERIGVSLQETQFIDRITLFETFQLFASFYRISDNRCQAVIEEMNLSEHQNRYINLLSGGQRQRAALGLALLHQPKILILDEPTTGLDPQSRRELWDILIRLRKEGITLILTTHYMEEAQVLCDQIVMMNQGKIIAQGTLDALLKEHLGHAVIRFHLETGQSQPNWGKLRTQFVSIDWDEAQSFGEIKLDKLPQLLPAFIHILESQNKTLVQIECRAATLEDLFLKLAGRSLDA